MAIVTFSKKTFEKVVLTDERNRVTTFVKESGSYTDEEWYLYLQFNYLMLFRTSCNNPGLKECMDNKILSVKQDNRVEEVILPELPR